jgi:hypothetical protein
MSENRLIDYGRQLERDRIISLLKAEDSVCSDWAIHLIQSDE